MPVKTSIFDHFLAVNNAKNDFIFIFYCCFLAFYLFLSQFLLQKLPECYLNSQNYHLLGFS